MPGRDSRHLAVSALGLLAAVISGPWSVCAAMNWEITPRFALSEILTDNVNLTRDDEVGALVTRFRPGVNIVGQGPRVQGNLSYTLDGIIALRGSSNSSTGGSGRYQDRLFHLLIADGRAELLKQHLFVDARARRRQFATNLAGPIGIDNTAGFNNLSAVTGLSVSPYFTNHFGSYADATLRYSYDRIFIDNSSIANTQINQFSGILQSGDAFGPVFWSLNANRTQTQRSGSGSGTGSGTGQFQSGTFAEASASIGYRLNRHFSVSATGGYQDNDFQSTRNTIDGPFWDVGFDWVPNRRASLSARYGERFFGKTGSLNLRYRRRATLWQASFNQSISTLRDVILTDAGTVPIFSLNCPPSDPSCLPIDEIAVLRPEAVQDIFVLARARASVTLSGVKHSATLAYSFIRRTVERDGAESRQQGVNLRWTWRLRENAQFITSGGWMQMQPLRQDGEGNLWYMQLGLTRDLGQLTSASLSYRHQSRNGTAGLIEYNENALIAAITIRFSRENGSSTGVGPSTGIGMGPY